MSDIDTITDELIEAEAQEWKQQEAAGRMARVLFEVSGNNLELAIAAVLEAAANQRGQNRALGSVPW